MDRNTALKKLAEAFPGGQTACAAVLGLTVCAFRNRLYEIKGQRLDCDDVVALSVASGSDLWVQALCAELGGVFVRLPDASADPDDLLAKFNTLYAELGQLSADFRVAIEDGEIDGSEAKKLDAHGRKITTTVQELLRLSFSIYCRDGAK